MANRHGEGSNEHTSESFDGMDRPEDAVAFAEHCRTIQSSIPDTSHPGGLDASFAVDMLARSRADLWSWTRPLGVDPSETAPSVGEAKMTIAQELAGRESGIPTAFIAAIIGLEDL